MRVGDGAVVAPVRGTTVFLALAPILQADTLERTEPCYTSVRRAYQGQGAAR